MEARLLEMPVGPPQAELLAGLISSSFCPRQLGTGLGWEDGNSVSWHSREGGLGGSHVTQEGHLHLPSSSGKELIQGE